MTFRKGHCLLAAALLSVGCASAGPKAPPTKPPEFADAIQVPTLNLPRSLRNPRIEMEMWIDSTGKPELETFRATGPGSELNQAALREWLGSARYRPAVREGQRVRGLFKMMLEGMVGGR